MLLCAICLVYVTYNTGWRSADEQCEKSRSFTRTRRTTGRHSVKMPSLSYSYCNYLIQGTENFDINKIYYTRNIYMENKTYKSND